MHVCTEKPEIPSTRLHISFEVSLFLTLTSLSLTSVKWPGAIVTVTGRLDDEPRSGHRRIFTQFDLSFDV